VRFNQKRNYEIKFGNNINGKKLNSGNQVAIYYLKSDGEKGEVGAGMLGGRIAIPFHSTLFDEIYSEVGSSIDLAPMNNLQFQNDTISTKFSTFEDTSQ